MKTKNTRVDMASAGNVADAAAPRRGRTGFTLIELLVVMVLLAVLAALMIAFFPNAATSAREARAATQLQGWLNIAKQRALRDQAPRGLRLWIRLPDAGAFGPSTWGSSTNYQQFDVVLYDNGNGWGPLSYRCIQANAGNAPTNGSYWTLNYIVTDCQYIEQPDDFGGGTIVAPVAGSTQVTMAGVDPTNGFPVFSNGTSMYWSVQPGDYLEVYGNGLMHQITGVTTAQIAGVTTPQLAFTPALPNAILTPTSSYRVLRAPRTVGEEMLKVPSNTLIDLSTNNIFGNTLPALDSGNVGSTVRFMDILFSPSGTVITKGLTSDKIHLWVRSPNKVNPGDPFAGDPTIVSVFVRTGFVGAFPPDKIGVLMGVPPNPYTFVK